MKILMIDIPAGPEDSALGGFIKDTYVPLMKKNIDLVRRPDTALTFRFCDWGLGPVEMAYCRYMDHLASRMVFYAGQHAEAEGFDALVVNCFGDPMLWELRQALDIPVVGLGESSMLMSSMMGLKFGIVHISPYNIPETEEHVVKYGLQSRCAGIRPIENWASGQENSLLDARETIAAFTATAEKLVADGAEIVIPGCSLMSTALRTVPGAEAAYPGGIREVAGAAVADVTGDAVAQAEALGFLKAAGSAWISRKNLFARPAPGVLKIAAAVTADFDHVFWDVT
jgi:Asp/Glu/hydantoin racemase